MAKKKVSSTRCMHIKLNDIMGFTLFPVTTIPVLYTKRPITHIAMPVSILYTYILKPFKLYYEMSALKMIFSAFKHMELMVRCPEQSICIQRSLSSHKRV